LDIFEFLALGINRGASDLHISAGLPPFMRVDGEIRRIEHPPLSNREVLGALRAITSPEQFKCHESGQDPDFALQVPGLSRFRVNALHQQRGAAIVMRAIPTQVPSMEKLQMAPVFRDIARLPAGLVCMTGPTGSGKSTSLAALLDYINTHRQEHILTIEDPIEFIHESKNCLVTQREVGRDVRSFDTALRAALREDPDIILIGELRDRETIALALTAAETGHLVFGTLHTAAAAKAIHRIVDVFPGTEKDQVRTLLAESLQAIVAQILVRQTGGGRLAAHEIMLCTPAIRNLIRENKVAQIYSAIQTGRSAGMQTLDQCLQDLVKEGRINLSTARQKALTPKALTPPPGSGADADTAHEPVEGFKEAGFHTGNAGF